MKIVGICGSPKREGSTTLFALKRALSKVEELGIETLTINLADYQFYGCKDCGFCRGRIDCSIKDDFKEKIIPLLNDPDIKGFIFASPVYFGGVSSQMKAFFDRSVMFRRNGFKWEELVCGALTVGRSRHGGQELAAMDIIKNGLIHGMTVVSDASPTSHFGAMLWSGYETGIENDVHGLSTADNLGKRVASATKKLFA